MMRMTPEREAAKALDLGVPRESLAPAAQVVYDRLVAERTFAEAARALDSGLPRESLAPAAQDVYDRLLAERRSAEEAAAQLAARMAKPIPLVTTDSLPAALGGDREVKRAVFVRVWGYYDLAAVEAELVRWVQLNGFDAVVGVRVVGVPEVSGSTNYSGAGNTSTVAVWAMYGTAIGW